MTSMREVALAALHQMLLTSVEVYPNRLVQRSSVLPENIPQKGLLILRDGTPGEPEVTMSPLRYHYQHRAEIEAFVMAQSDARDTEFDDLLITLGLAISTDRTLGGLCDWIEAEAPVPTDLPIEGANAIKAAVIPIVLHYSTSDPLI